MWWFCRVAPTDTITAFGDVIFRVEILSKNFCVIIFSNTPV